MEIKENYLQICYQNNQLTYKKPSKVLKIVKSYSNQLPSQSIWLVWIKQMKQTLLLSLKKNINLTQLLVFLEYKQNLMIQS